MKTSIYAWQRSDGSRNTQLIPLLGRVIHCARCDEVTWARSAQSITLEHWRVEHYPDCVFCPSCAKRCF